MSSSSKTLELIQACKRANLSEVIRLLGEGVDVNGCSSDWVSPILMAATSGSIELLELLLKKWANPNVIDEDWRTPLGSSIAFGRWEMMGLLFMWWADIGYVDEPEIILKKEHDIQIFNELQDIFEQWITLIDEGKWNDAVSCFMKIETYNFFDPFLNYYVNYYLIFIWILEIICWRSQKSFWVFGLFRNNTSRIKQILEDGFYDFIIKERALDQFKYDDLNIAKLCEYIQENSHDTRWIVSMGMDFKILMVNNIWNYKINILKPYLTGKYDA